MKANMLQAWRSTIVAVLAFGAVCVGVGTGKLSESWLLTALPILAPLVFGNPLNEQVEEKEDEGNDEPDQAA